MDAQVFTPTDFVAVLNQTLEFAYPLVAVEGELSNFRVSKNRWVYFDLKDEMSSVKCFATVYQLPGPLEDGMMIRIVSQPRLHQQFGFSLNVQSMLPVGEGSIKKAANLLEAQLKTEGLFDLERKRPLPYPPAKIGLIASSESAAFSDFVKILDARWGGVEVQLMDVQVQGERAVTEVVDALQYFNTHADDVDVLVITRGGGSADDLAAFSTEQVTRAVAASRIPTLVAIGHERDVSLAELAADVRASTPSNAAELLVPDKQEVLDWCVSVQASLNRVLEDLYQAEVQAAITAKDDLVKAAGQLLEREAAELRLKAELLAAYDPQAALQRGYAVIKKSGKLITAVAALSTGDKVTVGFKDGQAGATITNISKKG